MDKIKVLIVDDSAFVRKSLQKIIDESNVAEVLSTAADPYFAVKKIQQQKPDVISLDIQMPRMDGITFLKKIMSQHPIPVVIVSTLTKKESNIALEAYKNGATEVLEKPDLFNETLINKWKRTFLDAIKTAHYSNLGNINKAKFNIIARPDKQPRLINRNPDKVILIGSSAGGTEVVNKILANLDQNTLPIAIVQHMPAKFTYSYAERLNRTSEITVSEARSGDIMKYGNAYVSPGDKHLIINKKASQYILKTTDGEKRNRYRPSVDVLFESAVNFNGENIMAIILSGMGNDGSSSMMTLKNNGALTVAQDKNSCIVYGMPRSAYESGAASYSLSIEKIIETIKRFSNKQ
ncbi:MAG: chemotaxis response regulator protein-glutamate methylesterase [Chlorobi bacterium]|nr:chemotaxis response regulator protein-glutamate methylesterase [Chlorobiota bacterium]